MRFDTKLVHAGSPQPRYGGAVATPIFQSSTFEEVTEGGYHSVRYARLSNTPGHLALHARLSALENAEAALSTSSGMAAISAALLSVLRSGDHLIAQNALYGGTHGLLTHDFPRMGIEVTFVPGDDPAAWEKALRPRTRAIYFESLTNPLLRVGALDQVPGFAKAHDLVSLIDNTFATPLGFQPIARGFDLALHSATKYLNGHSDLCAGAVMGSAVQVKAVKHVLDHLGGSLDPHAVFLVERGLKTLGVRFRHQCASALRVARFLAEHEGVLRVHHPALPSHPDHARAGKLLAYAGAMLSFEPRDPGVLERLKLPIHAPSLGGPETLITLPSKSSHVGMSAAERAQIGISDQLLRVSIGLEDPDDLIEDFRQALQ